MCVLSASGTAATVNFAALGLSEPLAAARCDSREVRSALRLDASLTSQVRGEGDCDSREVRSALRLDASLTSQVPPVELDQRLPQLLRTDLPCSLNCYLPSFDSIQSSVCYICPIPTPLEVRIASVIPHSD